MPESVELGSREARPGASVARRLLASIPVSALAAGAGLGLLLLSVAVRLRGFGAGFWIDDGIAVGIASHPARAIPGVLRQDGSPPLYYELLHGWMAIGGRSENATYVLSLGFALACIPVAWWAGRSLWDARTGWTCAALAAFSPFLTQFSGQTRMYTLVVLLSLVACACFAHAFVLGHRRALVGFAVALAALLYTHGWGLFFGVGAAVAVAPCWWLRPAGAARRALLRDAALAFGAVAVAYLPWLPTLVYQAAHTAAPWSVAPTRSELLLFSTYVLGATLISPLTLAAAAGWASEQRRGQPQRVAVGGVLLVLLGTTLAVGWEVSRQTATWAPRYTAVGVGPALLVAGAGLARAGRLGLLCGVLTGLLWLPGASSVSDKSNVAQVVRRAQVHPRPGDLVAVTQPELVPLARYYLGPAPRYLSTLGVVADPQVMDWRDALPRLRVGRIPTLRQALDAVPPAGRVLVLRPKGPPPPVAWPRLIHLRTRQWLRALRADPRFRLVYRTARGQGLARLNAVELSVWERERRG